MSANSEQRRFHRVAYSSPATLTAPGLLLSGSIHDLSLKGALMACSAAHEAEVGQHFLLEFSLADSLFAIRMQVQVAHQEEGRLGLNCEQIDLDSIGHLRRLVELNLGDEALLDRELEHLIASQHLDG